MVRILACLNLYFFIVSFLVRFLFCLRHICRTFVTDQKVPLVTVCMKLSIYATNQFHYGASHLGTWSIRQQHVEENRRPFSLVTNTCFSCVKCSSVLLIKNWKLAQNSKAHHSFCHWHRTLVNIMCYCPGRLKVKDRLTDNLLAILLATFLSRSPNVLSKQLSVATDRHYFSSMCANEGLFTSFTSKTDSVRRAVCVTVPWNCGTHIC